MGWPTGIDRVDITDSDILTLRGSSASIGTAQIGATMASKERAIEVCLLGMIQARAQRQNRAIECEDEIDWLTSGGRKM